jgi:hypothetical protein
VVPTKLEFKKQEKKKESCFNRVNPFSFLIGQRGKFIYCKLVAVGCIIFDSDSVDFNKRRVFDIPCGYFTLGNVNEVKALN